MKRETHIYGLYFLKDTKTTYEDVENGNLLECVASVSNTSSVGIPNGLFFAGFLHALKGIMGLDETTYRMISFTDIGHNNRILDKWRWKYSPIFENPAAYYIYNMIVPGMPLSKEKSLILL